MGKQTSLSESKAVVVPKGREDHNASLRYAGMIQNAMFPDKELLGSWFNEHFVLFLPRDIVSGDFYYASRTKEYLAVAVGDATGHGVPGALLSILGVSFLNEIIQYRNTPRANRALNLMRERAMKALRQTGQASETKDSIDIGLCLYECGSNELQFAGANRPLILIRDGLLIEYKPDKMPIGIAPAKETAFTNNIIQTRPGDIYYLFSDGFPDQFGGKYDKKYKYGRFRDLLMRVSSLPLDKQKEQMEKELLQWKGKEKQVDDILVLGFKF